MNCFDFSFFYFFFTSLLSTLQLLNVTRTTCIDEYIVYLLHTILISEFIFFRFFVRFTWVLISSLLSGKFYLLAKSESTFLLYCLHFIVLLYIYFRIFFSFSSLCFLLPIKEYKNPAKPFFLLVSFMFTVKVFCNIKWRDDL